MRHCVNPNHKEIKDLAKELNLHKAIVATKVAIWQEDNNNFERFPTKEELQSNTKPVLNPESSEINQTSNLTDKEFYGMQNDIDRKFSELNKEESTSLYEKLQDESLSPKLMKQVEDKMITFLNKVGINVKNWENITDSNGNKIDAISKADIAAKLIEVFEGKRDITTLPEEASHVFVALIEGTPLYESMFEKIGRFDIYNSVKQEYGELYNNDETKIRKEAIAKLISAQIVNQEINENPLNQDLWSKVWNKIVTYIQNLLSPIKSREMQPFINSAKQILEGRIDGLAELDKVIEMNKNSVDDMVYYQLSNEEELAKNNSIDLLNKSKQDLVYNIEKSGFINKEGELIRNTIEDNLNREYAKGFKETESDKILAAKKTYIHKLANTMMDNLVNEKSNRKNDVVSQAKNSLLNNSLDIKELTEGKPEFFYIKDEQYNALLDGVLNIYNQIKSNNDRINALTGNTNGKPKIFTEIPLYHAKDDLVDSLDLLVMYPNGAAGLYSFEGEKFSMHQDYKTKESYVDKLTPRKEKRYNSKMFQFKNILREQYGIKHFAESRIVPINIQLNYENKNSKIKPVEGFKLVEIGNKDYLSQIPVAGEKFGVFKGTEDNEETKSVYDKDLDTVLDKMLSRRNFLYNAVKENPRDNIARTNYDNMDELIKRLQLNKEFGYAYNETARMYKLLTRMETEPSTSPNYEYSFFNEFTQFADVMQGFHEAAFKDTKRLTTENKKQLRLLPAMIDSIRKIAEDKIVEKLDADFTTSIKSDIFDTGYIAGIFKQLHDYNGEVYKRLAKLVEANGEQIRLNYNEFYEKMTSSQKDLVAWAKSKGLSEFEAYEKILNPENRNLVSKWDKKYVEELNAARATRNMSWLKENLEFNEEKYNEDKTKFFDYLDRIYPDKKDRLKVKVRKAEFERKHAKEIKGKVNESAYLGASWYFSLKDNPKYYSEDWNYMNNKGNEPLLNFYNNLIDFNKQAKDITGKDIHKNFVPELRQNIIDRVGQVGVLKSFNPKTIFNGLKLAMEAKEYEINDVDLDPVTKEPIPSIPVMYLQPVRELASKSELEGLQKQVEADGFHPGTTTYNDELNKRVRSLEYKKGRKFKSIDLTQSALLFAQTVYNYQVYNDTVDQIKSITHLMKSGEIHSVMTDHFGKPVKVNGEIYRNAGLNTTDLEIWDKFVKMYWYGHTDNKDFTWTWGEKKDANGKVIAEGTKFSVLKTYQLISQVTSLKALGLNIISGVGNVSGLVNNFGITATEGLYFTHDQADKAIKMIMSKDEKTKLILDLFESSGRNVMREKALESSASKLKKVASTKNLMFMLTYPDDFYSNATLLSMMQNYTIDKDGNLRKLNRVKDAKSIMDLAEIKDGKVTIPGITDNKDRFSQFRTKVQTVFTTINGPAAENNKNLMNARLITRILGKFRSWIPGLAKPRFQGFKYDETTEELNIGRFRVFADELFRTQGVAEGFQSFFRMMNEVLLQTPFVARLNRMSGANRSSFDSSKNIYGTSQNEYAAKMTYKRFLANHPEVSEDKVSFEDFQELRAAKLRGMAKELSLILFFFTLAAITKGMLPDKDEIGRAHV